MSYIGNEPIVSATRTITEISATAGQTVFTPNGGYTVGKIDVKVNGAELSSDDFTATNGSTVTLATACTAGDSVKLIAWGTFTTSGALQAANNLSDVVSASTARTNLGLNGPAFSAYATTNQGVTSGTTTKLTLDTEAFDTANCFASSRFTPTVAGYYQINGKIRATGTGVTANANLYKNGSLLIIGSYTAATGLAFSTVSTVVYLNGTTDYIELYGYADTTVGSPTFQYISVGNTCEMSGCLVRGA